MPKRKIVTVDDWTYESFEDLARKYGVNVNELMSHYLNLFRFIVRFLDEDVNLLSRNFSDVTMDKILQIALARILTSVGSNYETLKIILRHLGLYDRGFVLEYTAPLLDETGIALGVQLGFVASGISKSPITMVVLEIGVHARFGDYSSYYGRGGAIYIDSYIGSKDELKDKFEYVLTNLRSALKDESVRERFGDIEDSICDECDICDLQVEVEHDEESIELYVKAFAEDFTCLPHIKCFEEAISLALTKAGILATEE